MNVQRAVPFAVIAFTWMMGACSSESTTMPSTNPSPTSTGTSPGPTGSDGGGTVPQDAVPPKPTQSSITVSKADPSLGDGTLEITNVNAENAGGNQTELIRVTMRGRTNSAEHKILVYFFADNGQMSSVTHSWGTNSAEPMQGAEGIAYCDALGKDQPACTGVYHNFAERYFMFTALALKGKFPGPSASTLDGALLYPSYK